MEKERNVKYIRLCLFQMAQIMKGYTISKGDNYERLYLLPRGKHDEEMRPLPHMGRYKGKKVHLRKKGKGDQFGE